VSVDHDGDVIVLIVDAVRADVFADEELRERFPAFDAIASESVRFTTAYSPGNSTFTSLPSLLTGYAPNLIMTSVIRPESVSYDQLAGQNWWFDGGGGDVCRAMIAQSHDAAAWLFPYYPREIDVRVTEVRVNEVLHSSPYLPESVGKVLDGCSGRRMGLVLYADDPHLQLGKGHACAEGGTGGFECYLDEIEAVDSALTKVIKQLKEAGRWDDAAIIVTADHGEAFGERGHVGHTSNVFEEQVRVPLWLRVPGIAPRAEARPVSGLSVAPTAVELLGGIPRRSVYPSLLPLATATEGADYPPPIAESATGRMKKAWTSPQTAIRSGRYKVIYDWRTAYSALYDLESDPDEREPLTDHPEKERITDTLLRIERTLLTEWQQR
jgi:arylsulfatase A-like enzyme